MKLFGLSIQREATGAAVTGSSAGGTSWLERIVGGNGKASLNVAACWRCVNMISDSVAIMPLNYKVKNRATGVFETFVAYDRDRLNWLLNVQPNARMNAYTMKKTLVMQILINGNAFIIPCDAQGHGIDAATEIVDHLVLLSTTPSYNIRTNTYTVQDVNQGVPVQQLHASKVWHFKNPTTDGGFWGESTVGHAMNTLSTLATADKQALSNMSTGGRLKAILSGVGASQTIGTASKKQMAGAALDVEDALRQHDIVTLPDKNLELKPLSMSAAESQFVQSREFSVLDVARWYHVPPYKLGIGTSNYKTPDAAQVDYYTEAVQPFCSQIENELMAKTTTPTNYDSVCYDWDERPLFTLDQTSKAAWNKARLETGICSVNDLRRENDIAPVADGDTILLSANLKSISALKADGTGSPAPTLNTPTGQDNDD